MAAPVITPAGGGSDKTADATFVSAATSSRTWTPGDLLVCQFATDPAFGGTVTISEQTGNFGPFSAPLDVQWGTGTAGVRTVAGWCACTTGFTGPASVYVAHPPATARAAWLSHVTGADGATPARGSATSLGPGPTGLTVSLDPGAAFDALAVLLAGLETTGGAALDWTPPDGWAPVTPDLSATAGTSGGSPTSNVAVGWVAAAKTGVDAGGGGDSVTLALTGPSCSMAIAALVFAAAPVVAATAPAGLAPVVATAPAPTVATVPAATASAGLAAAAASAPSPAVAIGAVARPATATAAAPPPRVQDAATVALLSGLAARPPRTGWAARAPANSSR